MARIALGPVGRYRPSSRRLSLAAAAPAAAEVVRFEITSKTPYGSFRPGESVLWRGKVHGELAPTGRPFPISTRPQAQRPRQGRVRTEIMLLMPADPAKRQRAR